MHVRKGNTILEVLVVVAIIALLIGLLIPAVQRVREAGLRTESLNKLRQVILATHHFSDSHGGRLPTIDGSGANRGSLFGAILPYLEQETLLAQLQRRTTNFTPILSFVSPADPTIPESIQKQQYVASYAANALAFVNNPRLAATFPDGTSNTLAFAEHYGFGCGDTYYYTLQSELGFGGVHRATFADATDMRPITAGSPPVSGPLVPGLTFQACPERQKCNGGIAQTPHCVGMVVAVADGSGRILSPGISPSTYWSAITPAAGETLGSDW
jgi:type II secretory pathway pseudopilin PulG